MLRRDSECGSDFLNVVQENPLSTVFNVHNGSPCQSDTLGKLALIDTERRTDLLKAHAYHSVAWLNGTLHFATFAGLLFECRHCWQVTYLQPCSCVTLARFTGKPQAVLPSMTCSLWIFVTFTSSSYSETGARMWRRRVHGMSFSNSSGTSLDS